MVIKKYEAETETEAILMAKEELGKEAIVVSIKKINPKGVYRLFKKTKVEVTAAVDELENKTVSKARVESMVMPLTQLQEKEEKEDSTNALELKLENLENLFHQKLTAKQEEKEEVVAKNPYLTLIEEKLLQNEVTKENIDSIMEEIAGSIHKDSSIDSILSNVYQKIVLKLGQPQTIEMLPGMKKYIFFIGPTGVGKTTTIAKIASHMKLQHNIKVALITMDTYRIAAVEQLRTYATILGIPMQVVYSVEELEQVKKEFAEFDLVLIDTAGRSHKNLEQVDDINQMMELVPEKEKEVFLVLSATTKYNDLVKITQCYRTITNYKIIFTKLDETMAIGNILNIRMLTGAPLSYTTWGQNVPDDFGKVNVQNVAKLLLGGNE